MLHLLFISFVVYIKDALFTCGFEPDFKIQSWILRLEIKACFNSKRQQHALPLIVLTVCLSFALV
jgi:hypothetical protein